MAREKYHPISILLHWLMAILIVTTGSLGFLGANVISQKSTLGVVFLVHKTLGISVAILAIMRLFVRMSYEMNPARISKLEERLSKAGHIIMYLLMFAVPLSGYITSNAHGHDVVFFYITLPRIVSGNPEMASIFEEIHQTLAYTFSITFTLHAIMAVKHLVIDKINILSRMWGGASR